MGYEYKEKLISNPGTACKPSSNWGPGNASNPGASQGVIRTFHQPSNMLGS